MSVNESSPSNVIIILLPFSVCISFSSTNVAPNVSSGYCTSKTFESLPHQHLRVGSLALCLYEMSPHQMQHLFLHWRKLLRLMYFFPRLIRVPLVGAMSSY